MEKSNDARVIVVEALWKDKEFQEITRRVIDRLFPASDNLRADVVRALREIGLMGDANAQA